MCIYVYLYITYFSFKKSIFLSTHDFINMIKLEITHNLFISKIERKKRRMKTIAEYKSSFDYYFPNKLFPFSSKNKIFPYILFAIFGEKCCYKWWHSNVFLIVSGGHLSTWKIVSNFHWKRVQFFSHPFYKTSIYTTIVNKYYH